MVNCIYIMHVIICLYIWNGHGLSCMSMCCLFYINNCTSIGAYFVTLLGTVFIVG